MMLAPLSPAPLARWDARFRIVALVVLAFTVSAISSPRLLLPAAAIVAVFVALSGMKLRELAMRLRYPSLIVLALVALLPFLTGTTPAAAIGPLTLTSEGLTASLLIAGRFYCIITLALVTLGAAPLLVNIRALRALGAPDLVADMAMLTVRHIEVQTQDMRRMREAMRLRGHDTAQLSWRNLRMMAWLTGNLLLRSHERSERVYKAMRLRGYGTPGATVRGFSAGAGDVAALVATLLAAAALAWLEFSA